MFPLIEEIERLEGALVGETVIVNTETILRGEPLTDIHIKSETGSDNPVNCSVVTGVDTRVQANTTADKPVVAESVGLVRTTHNVSVGVTICILLSETADGEEEACCCKSSKNFHTFHNRL